MTLERLRDATVSYLTQDFEPADRHDYHYARIAFDNGKVIYLRHDQVPDWFKTEESTT